jgi:hypothetical protein
MPTQREFEQAADDLQRAAARLDELFTAPRQLLQRGVTIGGRFSDDLRTLFDHVNATFDRHATELRDLAGTCRARAEECAAHRSQWRAYHEARERYESELRQWYARADVYADAPTLVDPPGPLPVAPLEPDPPPAWLTRDAP